nr:hypothetical protein [Mycoplasmopsis bovis]
MVFMQFQWSLQIVMPNKIAEVAKALNIESFKLENISNFSKFDGVKTADKFILYNRIKK